MGWVLGKLRDIARGWATYKKSILNPSLQPYTTTHLEVSDHITNHTMVTPRHFVDVFVF